MQLRQSSSNVQVTGSRDAIEWALHQKLFPDVRYHALHGLHWLEVANISEDAEIEATSGGCRVHRK